MPALPAVSNTIRVGLVWNTAGGNVGSRFFIKYSGGPPSAPDLNTWAGEIVTAFNDNFLSYMTVHQELIAVNLQDLNSSSGNLGTAVGSTAGSISGEDLTSNVATQINFHTAMRYRGGHARIMLLCGSSGLLATDRAWDTEYVADINTAWAAFITSILGHTFGSFTPTGQVVVHYYSGVYTTTPPWRGPGYKYPPKPVPGPVTPVDVTSIATRQTVGSVRRRLTNVSP